MNCLQELFACFLTGASVDDVDRERVSQIEFTIF